MVVLLDCIDLQVLGLLSPVYHSTSMLLIVELSCGCTHIAYNILYNNIIIILCILVWFSM